MLVRRLRVWALLSDTVPFYPLYALLFADTGLSDAGISWLFVVWSVTSVLAEVPSGVLADRFSRRGAMALGGLAQAAGCVLWTAWPGALAFALGFVLWGCGGALVSGSLEALLHDGLTAAGQPERFGRVYGQLDALQLAANVPAAVAATTLFGLGGFALVGWASAGVCVASALVAARLPERRLPPDGDEADGPATYLATLRSGAAEALRNPAVRGAVVAVALLSSLDALEEYFGLLALDWGVPTQWVPLAVVGIPLAGALGSVSAGRLASWRLSTLTGLFGAAVAVFGVAGLLATPVGLFGVAVFYAGYRAVLVVANARVQERVRGRARATVTSFVGLGTELACLLVYGAWAVGQAPAFTVLALLVAVALPLGLRRRPSATPRGLTTAA
ncbi:MFS transporter [Saccharomonospora piscinae]|uniref:MFS transporter n=1 Tax=Saccharomonospora piscinae TaxID=687388 RepID=UPI0004B37E2F|nr:MFS transporter [Saccharomonospora piscinae]